LFGGGERLSPRKAGSAPRFTPYAAPLEAPQWGDLGRPQGPAAAQPSPSLFSARRVGAGGKAPQRQPPRPRWGQAPRGGSQAARPAPGAKLRGNRPPPRAWGQAPQRSSQILPLTRGSHPVRVGERGTSGKRKKREGLGPGLGSPPMALRAARSVQISFSVPPPLARLSGAVCPSPPHPPPSFGSPDPPCRGRWGVSASSSVITGAAEV